MMIAGYFSASCSVLTFGSITRVLTRAIRVDPMSTSSERMDLRRAAARTSSPSRDGVGSTWPLSRSSAASRTWISSLRSTRATTRRTASSE